MRFPKMFTPADQTYAKRFLQQGKLMSRYGAAPKATGYQRAYDYGQPGVLGQTPADRAAYKQFAMKIIAKMYSDSGKNLSQFIQRWRGVPQMKDPQYYAAVRKVLGATKAVDKQKEMGYATK